MTTTGEILVKLPALLAREDEIWSNRRRLRDYARVGQRLFGQRLIIYVTMLVLTSSYYSWQLGAIFFCVTLVSETIDAFVVRSILTVRCWDVHKVRRAVAMLYISTAISAMAISYFAISLAELQGPESGHFLPMIVLFSAAIFAAINNHQFLPILALRLIIYVLAILFIPLRDILVTGDGIGSATWLHFFTAIYVTMFLLECARSFLTSYTAHLKSRKALEEEHERTKAAYRAKTQFLATVSHELRTPLTSIKGALDVLNSGALGPVPDRMKGPLDVAGRNSHRLATLVSDLLLLQRAESGKIEINPEAADLGAMLRDIVDRFGPFAESMKAEIYLDLPSEPLWSRIDPSRFDQVISNLLSNAAKFSKEGAGHVRVSLKASGDKARIAISDNGEGIPEEFHDKVFQEFQQAAQYETRRHEGSGLGLSIAKRIVDAHGGRIWFTAEPGRGTTFTIELDRDQEPLGIVGEQAA